MKDLAFNKKYDVFYGHYSLGYLQENDLSDFMKRCRVSLLRDNEESSGLMIIKE